MYAQQRLHAKIGRFYISLILNHRFSTITCRLAPVLGPGRGWAQAGGVSTDQPPALATQHYSVIVWCQYSVSIIVSVQISHLH